MSEEPIAIHREANPERTGTFTLYPDRLDVVIKHQLRSVLTESIPLSEVSDSIAWLKIRSSIFNAAWWAMGVAIIGLVLIETFKQLESARALLYSTALFGLFLLLVGMRKILFLVVRTTDGRNRLVVGVGKSGRRGLEVFAERLQSAVSSSHAARGQHFGSADPLTLAAEPQAVGPTAMNDRRASARRLGWRIAIVLVLAAVLIDRISLYAWGLSVIRLYRGFCVPNSGSGLADMPAPILGFDGDGCHLDLLMYGSSVRPDNISVGHSRRAASDCTLKLLFLPPRLAWSTRLFPWGRWGHDRWPSVFYCGYELRITEGQGCHLYRAVYSGSGGTPGLTAVQPDSKWPHVY